jgi:hypothetical protein
VQYLMGVFLPPILAWLTTMVYRQMLARCADHPLVLLARWYQPSAAIAACAAYHHAPGTPGAPPTFTIDQFVRFELVRAWADSCSDPALEELLATNLLVRWFVDLPLLGPTPDHSTLADFHAWLTIHAPHALFADVLTFLERVDPEAATTPQIVDTFAMASPAAPSRTITHLLAHLATRMHRVWTRLAPIHLPDPCDPAVVVALADVPHAYTPAARHERLQTVLTQVQHVVTALTPLLNQVDESLQHAIREYQSAIAKVIADDLIVTDGIAHERPTNERGHHRLGSAVDREATFRKHADVPAVLGSNAVISTTTTRIRACVTLGGSTPDNQAPAAILTQLQAANAALPRQFVMDRAAGLGKTRAQTDALSDGQTQMVALVPFGGGNDPNRFTVADFQVDAAVTRCTCPNGVVSTRVYRHGRGEGDVFRFLASQCRGCPLWANCRAPDAKPNGHRTVTISDYHLHLRAGVAFNHTAEGRVLLRQRWRVEPTIAWLVRYHGCREARRIGRAAAQCQLYQACAVRNLLMWLSRIRRGLAARP